MGAGVHGLDVMNPRQNASLNYDAPEAGAATFALVPLVAVVLLVVSYPMYAAVAVGGVLTGLAVATVGPRLFDRTLARGRSRPRV